MITSVNNELVKETVKLQQKKFRDRENKFLLEGFKCIEEAFNAGLRLSMLLPHMKINMHFFRIRSFLQTRLC